MKFISEAIIDQVAEMLNESEENLVNAVETVQKEQAVLTGYFFSESFKLFLEEEKEYAFYLFLVIYMSIKSVKEELPQISDKS